MSPLRERLGSLMAVMAVLGAGLWALVLLSPGQPPGPRWGAASLLFGCFVAAELIHLHVEVRRQALSLSLSEIPFVLGLFLLPAYELLAVRLAGTLVAALLRRMSLAKIAFNLLMAAVEIAVVVVAFRALDGPPAQGDPGGPMVWFTAYVAMFAGTALSGVLVAAAITRLQGRLPRHELVLLFVPLLVSAALNTTVALILLLIVDADARATGLLVVLVAGVAAAYRGYGELLRRHRSLAQLHDLVEACSRANGYDEIVEQLLGHARALLRAGHAELLLDGLHGTDHLVLADGADRTRRDGVADELLCTAQAQGRASLTARRRRRRSGRPPVPARLRDAAVVPLRQEGRTYGALLVANRLGETSTFGERDLAILEMIGAQATVALHNDRLMQQLTHEAHHDALTGLPNRAAFLARTERALRTGTGLSVLLMDLDGFKEVNDTLGHSHGDELLKALAQRLLASVPDGVFVARLGGDEFAVLAPDPPGHDGLAVAEDLHRAMLEPFVVDGLPLDIRGSIGLSRYPTDGRDSSTLLKHADIAMYEAKTHGALVQAYDVTVDRSSHRRLALVGQLRSALEADALVCHYQPKVDLRSGAVVGAEALVRWPHPTLGLVPPDDFMPIAEQAGLIAPLTELVLRTALRQVSGWYGAAPVGVAVNVSPRGLLGVGFVRSVLAALQDSGVPPQRLTLEITESSVMADPARSVRVLTELHEAGVRLSVDDFGTGYSSLAYLHRLPVDEVKIDKSFVLDLGPRGERSAIVQAIIELGHTLGLQVVGEGVEDERTAALLRELSCDLAQGFLYSRPLEGEAFGSWLRQPAPVRRRAVPLARRA